jgi:carboxymethylenebutenolidase
VAQEVKGYPEAGHAFLNDHERTVLYVVAMGLVGGGYDEPSAHDARRRIVSFFDAHLRGEAPTAASPT